MNCPYAGLFRAIKKTKLKAKKVAGGLIEIKEMKFKIYAQYRQAELAGSENKPAEQAIQDNKFALEVLLTHEQKKEEKAEQTTFLAESLKKVQEMSYMRKLSQSAEYMREYRKKQKERATFGAFQLGLLG